MPYRVEKCWTCRERKVKCDNDTPSCGQCAKRGLACGGYEPDEGPKVMKIRDQTAKTIRKVMSTHTSASRKASRSKELPYRPSVKNESPQLQLTERFLPKQIDTSSANRAELLVETLHMYLPYDISRERPSLGSWMLYLPEVSDRNPAFVKAVDTVVAVQMGTAKQDQALLTKSKELYSIALRCLRDVLSCPQYRVQPETLAAICLLGVVDNFASLADGIPYHFLYLKGAAYLLRQHGPGYFRESEFALALLQHIRFTMAVVGGIQQSSVFLASQEWTRLPFNFGPQDEIWTNHCNLSLELTCHLEACRKLADSQMPPWKMREVLHGLESFRALNDKFFEQHRLHSGQTAISAAELDVDSELDLDDTFPSVYKFASFAASTPVGAYWILKIPLVQVAFWTNKRIVEAEGAASESQQAGGKEAFEALYSELLHCATEACKCFPFSILAKRTAKDVSVLRALTVTTQTFSFLKREKERAWCQRLRDKLIEKGYCVRPVPPIAALDLS